MSTIKDVARLAGVSLGTVSNVLNGKQAVNPDKVRRVYDAIKELNYKPHQTARSLKTSRTMNVAVVLPDILDPMKAKLFTGIERILTQKGYTVSLYTTSEIASKERMVIDRILGQHADGLIITTCQPENAPLFRQIKESDTAVILAERAVADVEFHHVGFDNHRSISDQTLKLLDSGKKELLLISGPENYSNENMCIEAFRGAFELKGVKSGADVISCLYNKEDSFRTFTKYLQTKPVPDAVLTTGTPLMIGAVKALEMQAAEKKPELYSLAEEDWAGISGEAYTRLVRQPIALGETAADLLIEELERDRPSDSRTILINNIQPEEIQQGFPSVKTSGKPVKVLMLESPAYRALKSLTNDFRRKTGINVEYTSLDYYQLSTLLEDSDLRSRFDVLQVDIPWLPDLVQNRVLLNLSRFTNEIREISKSFIHGVLSAYSEFENGFWALPFMFGTQLLYYRKDLFEDETVRLMFRERYGFELKVPATWSEFNLTAEFFTREFNPESPTEFGTTLGGKNSSGAVCEFLPRLWALDGYILDGEGRLNPDRTTMVKALNIYRDSFRYARPGSTEFWWDDQLTDFQNGNAAMMILFIAHAVDLAGTRISGKIGYDVIPGGCPLLGGWSMGINSETPRAEDSFRFISWAASKDLAVPQTILGGSTPSISLYKSSELLSLYPWLPKAHESFRLSRQRNISKSTTRGRISEKDFEQILGESVHSVITGSLDAENAADEAMNRIAGLLY